MRHEIRPAQRKDCELIRDMIFELARYEKLESACQATAGRIERELFCEHPVIGCVISWQIDRRSGHEEPMGFALYFMNFSTFLTKRGIHLEDLFIRPAFRGQGHGKALIKYLAQKAVELNCGRFEWTVLDWNQPAIDFYEHMGATVLQEWRICRLEGDALSKAAQK